MRLRPLILTSAVLTLLAAPGGAQAAEATVDPVCLDAAGIVIGCEAAPAPAPAPPAPSKVCPGRDATPTERNLATVRAATVCLVNRERSKRGLRKLRAVPALSGVAQGYARKMVRQRFFDHVSPDGSTLVSRIKRTGYLRGSIRRWSVGENIAWGTDELSTPEEIVRGWMDSAGHRRNILDRAFTELGMGVAPGAPERGAGGGPAATYVNAFGERRR